MKSQRRGSRFNPYDLTETFKRAYENSIAGFNVGHHSRIHKPNILVYTSTATLSTTAGTEFYSPYGGSIVWVKASVTGAPSGGALKIDLLVDGNSIFDSDYMEIPNGQKYGYMTIPSMPSIRPLSDPSPTPLKAQINTINSATGPMVLYIAIAQGGQGG